MNDMEGEQQQFEFPPLAGMSNGGWYGDNQQWGGCGMQPMGGLTHSEKREEITEQDMVDYLLEEKLDEVRTYAEQEGIPESQAAEEWIEGIILSKAGNEIRSEMRESRTAKGKFTKVHKKGNKKYKKMLDMNEIIHAGKTYENKNKFEVLQDKEIECTCSSGSSSSSTRPMGTQKWKDDKKIHLLSRVPEGSIGGLETPQWKRVSMAVDSGACETVADPSQIPCKVQETDASRRGACFASATGEAIPNMGEMTMPMYTREGSFRSMRVQAAQVTKPLASVMRIVQAGHVVVFDAEGSYIMNKVSGEINMLREEDGNYMLDIWVPPVTDDASGFPRQP